MDATLSLTDRARARILQLVQRKRSQSGSDLRLPSEAQLCQSLGVSRITVRRAMDQLVAAGDIVRHHGRGAFALMRSPRATDTAAAVGLLYAHDEINDYTGKIIAALERAARRRNMSTVICPDIGNIDSYKIGAGIPTHHGAIHGYISNSYTFEQLAKLEAHHVPTICLHNTRYLGRARYVIYEGDDNFTIPFKHMLSLGHRHLAYVGPNTTDSLLTRKLDPIRLVMQTKYPDATLSLVQCGGEWSDMPDTARRISDSNPAITGLLIYDDLIAAWLIAALRKIGRQVPEDVSLIAFNAFSDIRASLAAHPQITCMEPCYDTTAEMALELFKQILEGTVPARKRMVTVSRLIERESTAPPPAALRSDF